MNKEQQTIKKIKELVPEILELKNGCVLSGKFKNDNKKSKLIFSELMTYSLEKHPHILAQIENEFIDFQTEEILGRDITLEDCLIAVSKKQGEWSIRFWGNGVIRIAENIDWIPNKPFQDQSKETKDFIGDLILK